MIIRRLNRHRFEWDYPAKGFVFDKKKLAFAKYPKHIKSIGGFLMELNFRPKTYDEMEWHSDKEINMINNPDE